MKKYSMPVADLVLLETADIVTASFNTLSWGDFKNSSDVDNESGL